MRLRGASLSVIDATQKVSFAEPKCPHSLVNDGSDSVFYRSTYKNTVAFTGNAAALRGLDGAEIAVGESVTLPAQSGEIEIACATGETATVRVIPGIFQPVSS